MVKVYRLTLGFDPISSVDVTADHVIHAVTKVVDWLKATGNKVNADIVMSCELVSETNPLEVAQETSEESGDE